MRRRRPWIGVTTSEVRLPEQSAPIPDADPPQLEMVLGLAYADAISRAGGIPLVLTPQQDPEVRAELLDGLDGLCLSGGPDIDPGAYAAIRHAELGPTEPDLDAFEIGLATEASRRGIPVLGICRGAQAMNVARGGSLHQHLADVTDASIEHRQTLRGTRTTHRVRIDEPLALGLDPAVHELEVNSFHHQATDRLGAGLRAIAWSPDGVIEAIVDDRGALYAGVQWHAETLVARPEHLALFEHLVTQASGATASGEQAA